MSVVLGWVGPAENAIVALARRVAAAADVRTLPVADPADLPAAVRRLSSVTALHLHVNDWLFTGVAGGVSAVLAQVASILREHSGRLVLTLHDVPDPALDDSDLRRRRLSDYRRLVTLADAVIVSSAHEAARVAALTGASASVLPLPIDDRAPAVHPTPVPGTVGILGFVYPGKGHREVIDELAGLPVTVLALGRASDGQEYLVEELRVHAADLGVRFACTGYLSDHELAEAMRSVAVPVAPHRQVSASASMNHWITVGRRPLVAVGGYADELAARLPAAVRPYVPGELPARVRAALDDPARTWRDPALPVGPTTDEVARELVALVGGR